MNKFDRESLLEELEMLKVLLDFHIKNKAQIAMFPQEFENYVNAVLDRLNEIRVILEQNF